MTNATKAVVITVVNAALGLLVAFGVDLSDAQTSAITTFANAVLFAWVAFTYKDSPKRVEEVPQRRLL
jgi:hypothetical protein